MPLAVEDMSSQGAMAWCCAICWQRSRGAHAVGPERETRSTAFAYTCSRAKGLRLSEGSDSTVVLGIIIDGFDFTKLLGI